MRISPQNKLLAGNGRSVPQIRVSRSKKLAPCCARCVLRLNKRRRNPLPDEPIQESDPHFQKETTTKLTKLHYTNFQTLISMLNQNSHIIQSSPSLSFTQYYKYAKLFILNTLVLM